MLAEEAGGADEPAEAGSEADEAVEPGETEDDVDNVGDGLPVGGLAGDVEEVDVAEKLLEDIEAMQEGIIGIQRISDGILALMDKELIPSTNTGESKVFYCKTDVPVLRVMEGQASKLDGSCAAQAREWEELQRLRAEGLVAIRDTNKLLNDWDELIPKWLNVVKGLVDSEDLPLNVYRETLLQNKILRVIKKNHVTKYLEMLAEFAETEDYYNKLYEQFGMCLKHGIHEDSTVGVKTAEVLRFNTSKPGDEQNSCKEYVYRMTQEQNDVYYITGESIAMVSSSSFL